MIRKILIAVCLTCAMQPAFGAGRGYLGVWFGPLPATENVVKTGVIVKKVFPGMAAQKAGLKPGDIVTQINGVFAPDPKTAVALVAENVAGERISLTVIDRTKGGLRQVHLFPTMGDKPTSDFAKIMTAKPVHAPRALPPSSTGRDCTGPAAMRDHPCRADITAGH